jgi:hypothetical protein
MITRTESDVQAAGRKLVEKHVYHCLSALFYTLVRDAGTESFGDYVLSDFSRTDDAPDDPESADFREVYEQWSVSDWLAYRLQNAGETVREFFGMQVWLRTCTGQALYMDACFRTIVRALWRAEP